jgi:hypothetical protein
MLRLLGTIETQIEKKKQAQTSSACSVQTLPSLTPPSALVAAACSTSCSAAHFIKASGGCRGPWTWRFGLDMWIFLCGYHTNLFLPSVCLLPCPVSHSRTLPDPTLPLSTALGTVLSRASANVPTKILSCKRCLAMCRWHVQRRCLLLWHILTHTSAAFAAITGPMLAHAGHSLVALPT